MARMVNMLESGCTRKQVKREFGVTANCVRYHDEKRLAAKVPVTVLAKAKGS